MSIEISKQRDKHQIHNDIYQGKENGMKDEFPGSKAGLVCLSF